LGLGQSWAITTNDALRWELRANQTFGNDSLPNWTPVNFQAIFSYQWGK
jgi:OmpA-OmpF porin, OOP family